VWAALRPAKATEARQDDNYERLLAAKNRARNNTREKDE
jgi:hypothetical protein